MSIQTTKKKGMTEKQIGLIGGGLASLIILIILVWLLSTPTTTPTPVTPGQPLTVSIGIQTER